MTTKFRTPHKPGLPMAERRHMAVLEDSVGPLARMRVGRLAKKEAEKSLTALTIAKNQTYERVAEAELATTEMAVIGSIMAHSQRMASVLAEDMAAETGASQARLTTLAGAERITHVRIRTENYSATRARVQANELSEAEAEALNSRADSDLAGDVQRTDVRIGKTKDFVEDVCDVTLGTIKRPFDYLR